MLIAFANNQTLVAIGSTAVVVFTDPVPLDGNDRASAIWNIHAIGQTAGSAALTYLAQVSNDGGQNWMDASAVTDTASTAGVRQDVGAVNGALLRFKYTLHNATAVGTEVSFATFDLHVNLDHA